MASNSQERKKWMFYSYVAFLSILSVAFFLMPFGIQKADESMTLTYTAGVMFWVGLLGTVIAAICITRAKNRSRENFNPQHQRFGMMHFFRNVPATVFDVLMLIGILGFVIARVWFEMTVWPFVCLSLSVFCFGMHCMLNGSNYAYITFKTRRSK